MTKAAALPVLMYHHVSPAPGLVTVTPETFRAQMGWLAANGYRSIGCDDLARYLAGEALPERSVMISFDDGYLDNWVYAAPVLAEFGLRGVLFLITGLIGDGTPRPQAGAAHVPPCPAHRACWQEIDAGKADTVMLRWSEVAAMRDQGSFEFHSHTHSHTRWDRVEPDLRTRRTRLGEDLLRSRQHLATQLGSASDHLCWPQGYYDDTYREVARDTGFRYFYTVGKGIVDHRTDPELIPRIVTKDRPGGWFARRMWLYRRPRLSALYLRLRGD